MITVRVNGGLGNQMFQYATARALATKYHTDLILDINEFDRYELRNFELDKFKIRASIVNKNYLVKKIFKKLNLTKLVPNYYLEKSLKYDSELNNCTKNAYLEGYFQNERYFKLIRDELLVDFIIKDSLSSYTHELKNLIENSKNSVSLHIRRGDYISNNQTNSTHGTCSLEYYDKAIGYIKNQIGDLKIFVFSDDVEWSKENLKYDNIYFVEADKNKIPHEDIYLMSLCNHNIIANSSFSWWGAWLNNNNEKIVIAPKRWFLDKEMQAQATGIVCENWRKI